MATTPNYSFSVYSSTDTDVRFLDFRVATAGSQSTSNFYVIDTVLKQHSDAIDSINATPSAFVVKGTYSSGSLYTASVANYPGYKNEQLIVLSLNQKNTGAVQININGTTNKDVMKYGSDGVLKAVDAGDFVANSPVLCLYDGTRFVVIGITSASSITVTGEAGDILQIADDGTIESSGKKAAQPNGIATLDENGNVVQVANMANSAAAVYSGEPVTVEYAGENRISSITAYGNNSQTSGTTTEPVFLPGVDRAVIFERLPANLASPNEGERDGISVITNADGSVTVKGTATKYTWPVLVRINIPSSIVSGDITISLSSPASVGMAFQSHSPSGKLENVYLSAGYTSVTTKIKSGYTGMHIFLSLLPDQTIDETFHIMIAQGTEAKAFSPYVAPSITQLPIPRELHRIGDATDKCVTRTNSEYNRRLVFVGDDTEGWSLRSGTAHTFVITAGTGTIKKGASNRYKNILIDDFDETNGIYLSGNTLMVAVSDLSCNSVTEFKNKLKSKPLIVYVQAAGYDGTNGLDVCLTEYQTGFVELDGTEAWKAGQPTEGGEVYFTLNSLQSNSGKLIGFSSHFPVISILANNTNQGVGAWNTALYLRWKALFTDVDSLKAYLAAQKEAGTPVQVAYQLAAPEVYATDPVDFDNTAGPLTVVTGGQVEVKMTDFVTDRTPAFLNKLDKTGDGSDVTVTFTEAATDTDIASGDKLSILFGKILKRFTNILNGTTKVGYATKADTDNLGNQITGTYANSLGVANNTIVLKNKIGENLSTITVPYANSAGNVATSIKEMGIAVQTASPYAWFLNYTGSGNKDGARKYYASVYADNATYSTSAGSSNNIVIYNNNWSGTDGSISAIYANAEKTYVNLASSNAAGTAWPNISVQRINGHALNMALNGTSLSITW